MTGAFVSAALALTITTPSEGEKIFAGDLQSGRRTEIAGKVSGGETPRTVTVNGKRASVGPGKWRIDLRVKTGKNTVRVVATDAAGTRVQKVRRFRVVTSDPSDPGGSPDPGVPRSTFTDPNDSRARFDVRSGRSRVRGGRVTHTIEFWDRLRLRDMIGFRHGQISVHMGGGPGTGPPRWEVLITGHNGRLESLFIDHATGATRGARYRARGKTLKVSYARSAISRSRFAWHVDTGWVGGRRCPRGTGNAPTRYKCADRAGFGKVTR